MAADKKAKASTSGDTSTRSETQDSGKSVEGSQSPEDTSHLSAQMEELNKKLDNLNAKMERDAAADAAIMEQQKVLIANSNAAKSQEIMRQTIASPTGFVAKEIVNYVVKSLESNQASKTRQWMATRGRGIAESVVAAYIGRQLPMLNWYGTTVTGTQSEDKYHVSTNTNFPVSINTGVPLVGNVALARVILHVESDVDTKTNETSNVKCQLSTAEVHKDLLTSLQEDLVNWLKPHKKTWAIVHPIGVGCQKFYRLMKRETNFSIPFLILFIWTTLIAPQTPPANQIWGALGWPRTGLRFFGVSPQSLLFGILNGIIWGLAIWAIIRFRLIPGAGKVIAFIKTQIYPRLKSFLAHPYYRLATISAVLIVGILLILWRVGVFEPPPPFQMTTASVPNGRVGTEYSAQFVPTGGKTPYSFGLALNSLPEGLSLDTTTGKLTGIPSKAGIYPIALQFSDSSKTIKTLTRDYGINVAAADAFVITNTVLPTGKIGEFYQAKVTTIGGVPPYRWGLSSGQLPPGLVFDATGAITGKPTSGGNFTFAVTADDSSNGKMSYEQTYTLSIK